ncbi:hypothetical protein [Kitasatospora sp. CB01950]|uniref:hypothetical protein n=1 Tax=Kitasatospora sp. CB01950 TaxID=1703930 RepID=UPI0009604718|nr:hypothetical protein [Kitasatospora sp. CB01950]OKI95103.1 hypothetical protein AMK19_33075 [Kitasatospora sp. CB01950]
MFSRKRATDQTIGQSSAADELAQRAASVFVSTLPTAQRPYRQVAVLAGEPAQSAEQAWQSLRRRGAEHGCDAVLGAGLTSWAGDSVFMPQFLAFGTGVSWSPEEDGEPTG